MMDKNDFKREDIRAILILYNQITRYMPEKYPELKSNKKDNELDKTPMKSELDVSFNDSNYDYT